MGALKKFDAAGIRMELGILFPEAQLQICDSSYNMPTARAVRGLTAAVYDELRTIDVDSWEDEFDCDKGSRLAWAEATKLHIRVKKERGRRIAQGVLFGMIAYRVGGTGEGHMRNLIRLPQGWRSYEWQAVVNGGKDLIPLTDAERQSAWWIVI